MAKWEVIEEGKGYNLVTRYIQYAQQAEKHILFAAGSLYSVVSFPRDTRRLFSELERKALDGCRVELVADIIQFETENHPLKPIVQEKYEDSDRFGKGVDVFARYKEPIYHRGIYVDGRSGLIETEQNEQNRWKDVLLAENDIRIDPLIMTVFRYLNMDKFFQKGEREDNLPIDDYEQFRYVKENQWRRANRQENKNPPHKIANKTRFLNTQADRRKGLIKRLNSLHKKAMWYNWLLPKP